MLRDRTLFSVPGATDEEGDAMMLPNARAILARAALLFVALVCSASKGSAQAAALNWWADDSLRIAMLTRDGIKAVRANAIVWAPRDSMPEIWVAALADTLDRGVAKLREIMRGPYEWQRIGDGPVTFYLSPGRFVSHGTGYGAVFIPVSRVHERVAPFLHEASHELLAPQPPFYRDEFADSVQGRLAAEATPLWLFEGLPDYLAQTAAPAIGLHEGDVFEIGGLAKVDSACAARVQASPHGQAVIDVMGRGARLAALFTTERAQVAPVFYACGQSLTRHIVERIGVRAAVELIPATRRGTWERDLERAAGQSIEVLRQGWLERIGLEGRGGGRNQSLRSATSGSIDAARTAGATHASTAAASNVARMAANASGAMVATPDTIPRMICAT
jgi:hypothetical protein